ncbi:MAG: hypothetical protein ACJA00_001396 [Myxococcota bacterium]
MVGWASRYGMSNGIVWCTDDVSGVALRRPPGKEHMSILGIPKADARPALVPVDDCGGPKSSRRCDGVGRCSTASETSAQHRAERQAE